MHVLLLLHMIPGVLGFVFSWQSTNVLIVQMVFSIVVYLTVHLAELKSLNSFRSNINLKPRCALVTGGSSGIGAEIAKLFIRDGYHVIVASNDSEKTIQEAEKQFKLVNKSPSYQIVSVDLTTDGHERNCLKISSNNN